MSAKHLIIVVGAGPAGLSVANMMSKQGHEVVVLNRDIKFGGLAEYGIFPNKHKLRGGVRKGYWEIPTGAQGTKTIGVEGDTAQGVYHAKDCVYHFNRLPGYSTRPFDMGQRVAVI